MASAADALRRVASGGAGGGARLGADHGERDDRSRGAAVEPRHVSRASTPRSRSSWCFRTAPEDLLRPRLTRGAHGEAHAERAAARKLGVACASAFTPTRATEERTETPTSVAKELAQHPIIGFDKAPSVPPLPQARHPGRRASFSASAATATRPVRRAARRVRHRDVPGRARKRDRLVPVLPARSASSSASGS